MNKLLPIIAQLSNARSHADRADWLKRCPLTILAKYDFTIRNRLEVAGFPEACEYLDAARVARQAVRDERGLFGTEVRDVLEAAGHRLALQAAELDRAAMPPAPPDPTEL